ncbi:unnamed protein product [Bubo scandiacus]
MKTCPCRPPKEVFDASQLRTVLQHQNHSRSLKIELKFVSSMAVTYEDICRPCCPVRYPIIDCSTGLLVLFFKPVLSPISILFLI